MKTKLLLISTCLLALGACQTASPALDGILDTRLGQATTKNINAHAVVPPRAQKQNTYIPADPTRASKARENYRENTVPEPASINP